VTDLSRGVLLAVLAFFLGLVANQVNRLLSRERKRLAWTLSAVPIVSVSDSLPDAVRSVVPAAAAVNVYQYVLSMRSTGRKPVSGVKLEIVPESGTTLLSHEVRSTPPRGVGWSPESNEGEIRLNDIALTRNQELTITAFAKSSVTPSLKPYFSGGGDEPPEFEAESRQNYQGIEQHVASIIRNYVASIVAPAVVGAIGSVLAGTVFALGPSLGFDNRAGTAGIQIGTAGFLQVLSAVVNAYFLLRIVPPALALVRIFTARRISGSPMDADEVRRDSSR
jgi:hypothetical protein